MFSKNADHKNFRFAPPGAALFALLLMALLALATPACKHDALAGTDPTDPTQPIDTTGNGGGDTTVINPPGGGMPCDPNTVYFQNQVLPLLVSNCAKPGCHTVEDHQKGVILTSYEYLMSTVDDVNDNDWEHNELMEVLVLNDDDDRMPPAPNQKLSLAQVDLIAKWIGQGAQNNKCDENAAGCDLTQAKYAAFVQPLIQQKCQGCHSGSAPSGNVNLTTYNGVKTVALNGKLHAAVTRTVNPMPRGGARLDDCTLDKLKAWIDGGALQN